MSIEEKINQKIALLASATSLFPCVTIVHRIADASVVWMCNRGLKELGISLEKLINLSKEEYYNLYFNPDDVEVYTPKIVALLERNNDDESVSFLQQVKILQRDYWTWHMSCTKVLLRDELNQPVLLITQSIPIEHTHSICLKADKILEENAFLKENFELFAKLSPREREILKHLAAGKTSIECGETLFISSQTVDTHRKNIRKKLGINSFTELIKYARSFDLVSLLLINSFFDLSGLF
ncbi:MAG TPA: helix-turn-helix transcriptional regulator [Pelobium sp.]